MKVDSIEKLRIISQVNQDVFDILSDFSVGRKKASDLLTAMQGTPVSEKLIRTWREAHRALEKGYEELAESQERATREFIRAEQTRKDEEEAARYNAEYEDIQKTLWYSDTYKTSNLAAKNIPHKRPMVKTSKTIVIMPDVQAPLHDTKLVDKFVQFLADYEPNELAQVGDFTDSTEISRWVRGKKPEFAGDLASGMRSSRYILEKVREVFDGRFRIVRSNHDDRLELYIQSCAPGLASLSDLDEDFNLTIERLAGFDKYGVEFIRDEVVELTPTARDPWIMAHGDEGALNSIAGRTAFNLAKNKFGANVVCGHTHRAGLTGESYGYNGKIRSQRQGLEVGHFMDLTLADYLKKKGVAANWQQAFGILHIHGSNVYPQLVQVDYEGNFSVEGVLY